MPSALTAKGEIGSFINSILQMYLWKAFCAVHVCFLLQEQRVEIQIEPQ